MFTNERKQYNEYILCKSDDYCQLALGCPRSDYPFTEYQREITVDNYGVLTREGAGGPITFMNPCLSIPSLCPFSTVEHTLGWKCGCPWSTVCLPSDKPSAHLTTTSIEKNTYVPSILNQYA